MSSFRREIQNKYESYQIFWNSSRAIFSHKQAGHSWFLDKLIGLAGFLKGEIPIFSQYSPFSFLLSPFSFKVKHVP